MSFSRKLRNPTRAFCKKQLRKNTTQNKMKTAWKTYLNFMLKEHGGIPPNEYTKFKKDFEKGFMDVCVHPEKINAPKYNLNKLSKKEHKLVKQIISKVNNKTNKTNKTRKNKNITGGNGNGNDARKKCESDYNKPETQNKIKTTYEMQDKALKLFNMKSPFNNYTTFLKDFKKSFMIKCLSKK